MISLRNNQLYANICYQSLLFWWHIGIIDSMLVWAPFSYNASERPNYFEEQQDARTTTMQNEISKAKKVTDCTYGSTRVTSYTQGLFWKSPLYFSLPHLFISYLHWNVIRWSDVEFETFCCISCWSNNNDFYFSFIFIALHFNSYPVHPSSRTSATS